MCCWYFEESSSAFKNIKYQKHYELILLFHASAHDRNTKWNFFALLLTSETPNETFSCFCTRQKHQMKLFRASAHDRNTKWNFFVLLHTAERPKRRFPRFCTLQKDQKEVFHAAAHCRKTKKKISALGESRFPKGLAFPRSPKVISRKVWHFRAWRKSFPEWFGVSAYGESYLLKVWCLRILQWRKVSWYLWSSIVKEWL